jgi:hypothetical protein
MGVLRAALRGAKLLFITFYVIPGIVFSRSYVQQILRPTTPSAAPQESKIVLIQYLTWVSVIAQKTLLIWSFLVMDR